MCSGSDYLSDADEGNVVPNLVVKKTSYFSNETDTERKISKFTG